MVGSWSICCCSVYCFTSDSPRESYRQDQHYSKYMGKSIQISRQCYPLLGVGKKESRDLPEIIEGAWILNWDAISGSKAYIQTVMPHFFYIFLFNLSNWDTSYGNCFDIKLTHSSITFCVWIITQCFVVIMTTSIFKNKQLVWFVK